MTNQITFNNLPEAIQEIHKKLDLLLSKSIQAPADPDKLLTIEELIEFVPGNPAKQTVYGWINNRLIPFEKHGKRLYFRQSAIQEWLDNGRK